MGADYYETDVEIATLLAEGEVPMGIGRNSKIRYAFCASLCWWTVIWWDFGKSHLASPRLEIFLAVSLIWNWLVMFLFPYIRALTCGTVFSIGSCWMWVDVCVHFGQQLHSRQKCESWRWCFDFECWCMFFSTFNFVFCCPSFLKFFCPCKEFEIMRNKVGFYTFLVDSGGCWAQHLGWFSYPECARGSKTRGGILHQNRCYCNLQE